MDPHERTEQPCVFHWVMLTTIFPNNYHNNGSTPPSFLCPTYAAHKYADTAPNWYAVNSAAAAPQERGRGGGGIRMREFSYVANICSMASARICTIFKCPCVSCVWCQTILMLFLKPIIRTLARCILFSRSLCGCQHVCSIYVRGSFGCRACGLGDQGEHSDVTNADQRDGLETNEHTHKKTSKQSNCVRSAPSSRTLFYLMKYFRS